MEILRLTLQVMTLLLAGGVFVKGLIELSKKNQLDRAGIFLELRKRFKETENFSVIISYLDSSDPELAKIPQKDKLKFLGFLEDGYFGTTPKIGYFRKGIKSNLAKVPLKKPHDLQGFHTRKASKCYQNS